MARRDHSRLEAMANKDFLTEEAIEHKEELLRRGFTITEEPTPFDEPEQKTRPEDLSSPDPAKDPRHESEDLELWISAGRVYNSLIPTIREQARLIEGLEEARAYQEIMIPELVCDLMPSTPEEPHGGNISPEMMRSTVFYLLAYAFKMERAQAKKIRETFGGKVEYTD